MLNYIVKYLKKQAFIGDVQIVKHNVLYTETTYYIIATLKISKESFKITHDLWASESGIKKFKQFSKVKKQKYYKQFKETINEFFKNEKICKNELRLNKLKELL